MVVVQNNNQKLHKKFEEEDDKHLDTVETQTSDSKQRKRKRKRKSAIPSRKSSEVETENDTLENCAEPERSKPDLEKKAVKIVKFGKSKNGKVNGTSIDNGFRGPKTVEFYSDDEEDGEYKHRGPSKYELINKSKELLEIRKALPVYKAKDELLQKLETNRVTILIGETGSGKSTQIPQFLMGTNKKGIAVTQPRRVAAINLANRVAQEVGTTIGDQVGYSVRFDNRSNNHTKLKYLTDGMLLREIMLKPTLPQYSTVIIDEAHERTVLTDLLMGFLKELMVKRKDLKLIIMSATLDAEKFSKFFDDAEILYVEGRMFSVDRLYLETPVDDIVDSVTKAIIQINNGELEGDVLVFLPGQEEIDKCVGILERVAPALPREAPLIVPLPLYAALPPQEQAKVFLPLKSRRRKVILSTNIAETSVTVPGVKYVIDSGLRKVKVWRHQLGLSTLLTAPVSKASALQRAGRAGRETEGKCFRLYTEQDYLKLPNQTEAEISRSNVVSPVLMLKRAGVEDILNWYWLEHPGQDALISALQQLYQLKALDNDGKITEIGIKMSILPLEPQLSAILLNAYEKKCLAHVIDIVSCLSVDNLVMNPTPELRDEVNEKRRSVCSMGAKYGDLLMLKEIFEIYLEFEDTKERQQWCKELALSYRGFRNVVKVRNQIRQYMSSLMKENHLFDDEKGTISMDVPSVLKSFLSGYISNTAIGMPDRSYRTTATGQLISIHPSSMIFGKKADAIMYTDYVFTTKSYARNVSAIDLSWLQEVSSEALVTKVSIK